MDLGYPRPTDSPSDCSILAAPGHGSWCHSGAWHVGQCPLVLEYLQPIQLEIDVPGTTHGANNTTRREGALESEGS
jgi:hypothetical protein